MERHPGLAVSALIGGWKNILRKIAKMLKVMPDTENSDHSALVVILFIATFLVVLVPAYAAPPAQSKAVSKQGPIEKVPSTHLAPSQDLARVATQLDALTALVKDVSSKVAIQREDDWKAWLAFWAPILSSGITALIAYWIARKITRADNVRQQTLQEIELAEKFMPHFEKGGESVRAALRALAGLDARDLACHFAFVFASPQSVVALEELLHSTNEQVEQNKIRKSLADTLNVLVSKSFLSGDYLFTEHWLRKLIQLHSDVNTWDHLAYATALRELASTLDKRGYLTEAEKTARQALVLVPQGTQPRKIAHFRSTLGTICEQLGLYTESESLISEADTLCDESWESMPEKITYRTNMATVFERKGQYSEAEKRYREAINFHDQRYGPLSEKNGLVHSNLGLLYKLQGRSTAAEAELTRSLHIRLRCLGPEHPDTLTSLTNLADHYIDQRRSDEAQKLIDQAQNIVISHFGEESMHMALVIGLRGKIAGLKGDIKAAIEAEQEALGITELAVGANHIAVSRRLTSLASLHMRRKDYPKAIPLIERSLAISQSTCGEPNAQMSLAQFYLAEAYMETGKLSEAEALLQQSLSGVEKTFGKNHPRYAQVLNRLAGLFMAKSQPAEAIPLLLEALKIQHDHRTGNDIAIANTMHNLGCAHFEKRDLEEAVTWLNSSITAFETNLGSHHPELIRPLYSRLQVAKALKNQPDQAKYESQLEQLKSDFPNYLQD